MDDVLICGGGPAGSTAATLLRQYGHSVRLIEKEKFPRFHIGESLLPADLPVFQRLGVELPASQYLRKDGAMFVNERTGEEATYLFADALPEAIPHAYQAERAIFDDLLLKRSQQLGASIHEEEKLVSVDCDAAGVVAVTDKGTYHARYFVDATGQDAFLARKARTVDPLKGLGRAAVFCHFSGLKPEVIAELHESGNIRVLILEDGWVWLIPLADGRLSAGVVRRDVAMNEKVLEETFAASPMITRLTEGATRTHTRVIRNFSFKNTISHGARFCCIGDASCFLDPVFSSGVTLALISAEHMADTLHPALVNGTEKDPDLMIPTRKHMDRGYAAMGGLVRRFYESNLVDHLLFAKDPPEKFRKGLISILAADLWRDDNVFQDMLEKTSRYSL